MIQIDTISNIPGWDWAPKSAEEWDQDLGWWVEKRSERIWAVSCDGQPLAVAGLLRHSLVNPPWLWFLLTQNFVTNTRKYLHIFREIMKEVDFPLMTLVENEFAEGDRFARAFGWRPTGDVREMRGKTFNVMRRG